MRLFVAIEASDGWREVAGEVRDALDAALGDETAARLRWVAPELLHLTLRFIGEVDEHQAAALQRALDTAGPVDLALSLGAAGTFGPPARTQVVWLAVGGDEAGLIALADRVERAVAASGLPAGDRSSGAHFRAHLTLARVHRRATRDQRLAIAQAVAALANPAPSLFRARSLALVRSHLGAGPVRHELLSRHGAAGGCVG